jgi:hypothetical protein
MGGRLMVSIPDYGIGKLHFHVLDCIQILFVSFKGLINDMSHGKFDGLIKALKERIMKLGLGPYCIELVDVLCSPYNG